MRVSKAIQTLPRSGIRAVFELALTVEDAIHLEVGEPSFDTPAHIVEAADRAARDGFTKYTPNAGIPVLREALAEKLRTRNSIVAEAPQVVVTSGAVAGIFSALAALVDPGDEVLVADPSWPNYALMTELLSIRAVHYPLQRKNALVATAADMEPLITPRTKAIVINSPSNPAGAVGDEASTREILDLARRHDLWIISDEVYDEIWFDHPPVSIASMDDEGRVVTCFSFSKTYAMTGFRIGYLVARADVADHIIKAQEPITSCVNAPAQLAAVAALAGAQDCVRDMRASYKARRDRAVAQMERLEIPHVRPQGAFYLMVDIGAVGLPSTEFARRLVLERGVAVAPGQTFGPGSDRWVRVSLASPGDALDEGIDRLGAALADWRLEGHV